MVATLMVVFIWIGSYLGIPVTFNVIVSFALAGWIVNLIPEDAKTNLVKNKPINPESKEYLSRYMPH